MPSADGVYVLTAIAGRYAGERYSIQSAPQRVLGRASGADIQLEDDTVSRRHARFYASRGRVWVRDLGSRNGTQVNGETIAQHAVAPGDRIAIGSSLFRVELVDAAELESRTDKGASASPETREATQTETSGRSMTGTLADIPLADVLQWLGTSRKSGTLRVRGKASGELLMRSGSVYWARIQGSPSLKPERALLRMLQWNDGTFSLDSTSTEEAPGEMGISLEGALMEAARLQDELAHLASTKALPTGSIEAVVPSPRAWKTLSPDQLDVLELAFAGKTWTQMLDLLDCDEVVATKAVLELQKHGVVRF